MQQTNGKLQWNKSRLYMWKSFLGQHVLSAESPRVRLDNWTPKSAHSVSDFVTSGSHFRRAASLPAMLLLLLFHQRFAYGLLSGFFVSSSPALSETTDQSTALPKESLTGSFWLISAISLKANSCRSTHYQVSYSVDGCRVKDFSLVFISELRGAALPTLVIKQRHFPLEPCHYIGPSQYGHKQSSNIDGKGNVKLIEAPIVK